jgi:hypothetical protein
MATAIRPKFPAPGTVQRSSDLSFPLISADDGPLQESELHTSDLKALNHIFTNGTLYQKPEPVLANTVRLVGKGTFEFLHFISV